MQARKYEHQEPQCGGCEGAAEPACIDAFSRLGVIKACWECWSLCNLACKFCYRSRSVPLAHDHALRLIRRLWTGGVQQLTFAGGDPSLRDDLRDLVSEAKYLGLKTEVQTNGQFTPPRVIQALLAADLVGLSLDGATPEAHDSFRSKRGNFSSVFEILDILEANRKPVVVRSVVARPNAAEALGIARLISPYSMVKRWSLMQFSPIQEGFRNRDYYGIHDYEFAKAAYAARSQYSGSGEVDIYFEAQKAGTYLLIASNGDIYGRVESPVDGVHPTVGNVLTTHLSRLAETLPFSRPNHARRYSDLM